MDPDPALFVSDLQDANKTIFAYYFLKVHLHHSAKIKNHKEVEIKVFLTIFVSLDDGRIRIQIWIRIWNTGRKGEILVTCVRKLKVRVW